MSTTETRVTALAGFALRRLERERETGYAESAHVMRFPRALGFGGPDERHRGDVFVRAIVADALCDARDAGLADVDDVLEDECDYLVGQGVRSGVGGWPYFPDLPELPPDTDVLAQVLQVLVRCGREDDLRLAAAPLAAVLADVRPDGAVGTWILPARPETAGERRQARFVRRVWGDASDPEVNANLLYALALLGREEHGAAIERGVAYVAACRRPDGTWPASWYAEPFYGTYVAVRLLSTLGRVDAAAPAAGFLERTRREDGGWGARSFDQLGTGLALCTAALLPEPPAAEEAFARLHRSVEGHGWKGSPFIVMNLGRARGRAGPVLTYGSPAVTAAYGLKAAAAWWSRGDAGFGTDP